MVPKRLPIVLSTAAVGALTAVTLWPSPTWLDAITALTAVIWVPVMLRRPLPAAWIMSVLALLSPAATPAATVAALHTARRKPFKVAASVAAVGLACHAIQGLWRPNPGLPYRWWLLLVTVTYAALLGWGAWAQAREALVASLRERAERAEHEQEQRVAEARLAERNRLAREMHDVLAHRLSLLATYAGALEYRPDAPPQRLAAAAGVIREGVHLALNELREVVTLMRADGDEELTVPDIASLVDESRAAGLDVRLDDRAGALPKTMGYTAQRVVREALTNARKHAPGQPVTIVLEGTPGDRLTIEVNNPLVANDSHLPGVGLIGLAERVSLSGGELTYQRKGNEFRLCAWIPW